MRSFAIRGAVLGMALVGLVGCTKADMPTCQEFAHLAEETGLFVKFTDEQVEVMTKALQEAGYEASTQNKLVARNQIVSYCNIYKGVANSHKEDPITEAFR